MSYNTFDNQIKDIIITIETDTENNFVGYSKMRDVKLVHKTPDINIVKKTYKSKKFALCCCISREE